MNRRNITFLVPYNPRPLFALVDQKEITKRTLITAGIPVPETYAELAMLWDVRGLARVLEGRTEFVIKPARGSGGGGVQVIADRRGGDFVKASGALISAAELEGHCSDILAGAFSMSQRADTALIEYRVKADAVLGAISYRGVPDVRILVFRGVPVQAMIRLPTRASDGRANLHMGGMAVGVDLATGVTTHGSLGRQPCAEHPDLACPVVGVAIPGWATILDIAARCYDVVPLGYLGVDVVLDEDLGPLVLELNARPGLTIQLANRRGLRPALEAIAGMDTGALPAAERVRVGTELAAH